MYKKLFLESIITQLSPTPKWASSDSKVHVANMGPTCVLAAPGGPHIGPMNLAIRVWLAGNCSFWSADSIADNQEEVMLDTIMFINKNVIMPS